MNAVRSIKSLSLPFRAAALAASFALAGCAGGPKPASPPVTAGSAQNIEVIAELLNQGDADAARKLIKTSLKRDPNNPSLALLRDSVTRDPVDLLGPKAFDYVVQPGETLASLADRFLGNRLMTYQLARYNGIEKPVQLAAGRKLRIPGAAPTPAPVRRAAPAPARPTPAAKPPREQAARPAAVPAPAARNDPAAARQLRTQGLAALNKGAAAKAVQLLRRAAVLDPASGAIRSDLARAERIAATVKARK